MPGVNHVMLASGAAVAVSVAVATAIVLYESTELRRYADDVRRRIATALHSLGDGVDPEPMFNRPEDMDGFMQSRNGQGAEPGVDADEETRRRQREELLYWNRVRLEKQVRQSVENTEAVDEKAVSSMADSRSTMGLHEKSHSFDDFLTQDHGAEHGTYVFKTGADAMNGQEGLRRRSERTRNDNPRGFAVALQSNPFADEHGVGSEEIMDMETAVNHIAPTRDEISSDIYSATTRDVGEHDENYMSTPNLLEMEIAESTHANSNVPSSVTLDQGPCEEEYMTAGQENREEAYASIQAWAQDSSRDFYSPLPVTPAAPMSEPELVSEGEMTPTDSVSLAGSGEDVGDALSSRNGGNGTQYDVLSESDGMLTPASWSEVGSVVSDN